MTILLKATEEKQTVKKFLTHELPYVVRYVRYGTLYTYQGFRTVSCVTDRIFGRQHNCVAANNSMQYSIKSSLSSLLVTRVYEKSLRRQVD
jgi:hypothetical protein